MASFQPIDHDPFSTESGRGGSLISWPVVVLGLALLATAGIFLGIPFAAREAGFAWEAGRAQAASQALAKLDEAKIIDRASALFRLASTAVEPAVVNVRTSRRLELRGRRVEMPPGGGVPLGAGSGVIIDKQRGFIVTNHHVIREADGITVRLGPKELPAKLVGADPKTDLAVLQVAQGLPAEAPWGDSDKLANGDWVLAIGSPFELDRTVTAGIVSATGRGGLPFAADVYQDFIQTDAAINPGNSGGPLVNLRGEVVGINTAILSETGSYQGVGLAISSSMARRVVEQLIEKGRVIRGYLGVSIRDVRSEEATVLKVEEGQGAAVLSVEPGSPADLAGLQPGDVVVSIGGKPVSDSGSLRNTTFSLPINRPVSLVYYREGKRGSVDVSVAEMPVLLELGLRIREVAEAADAPDDGVEAERSVYVDGVLPGSPAGRAGLRRGMRVLEIDGLPVRSRAECDRLASTRLRPGEGLPIRLQSPSGQQAEIVLGGPPPERP